MSICEKCGTEFETEKCPNCEAVEESKQPVATVPEKQSASKKKKGMMIGVAVAIAVFVLVVLLVATGKKDKVQKYTVFIKDNAAYYLDSDKKQPILIAENIYANEEDVTSTYSSSCAFKFASNNKIVFYPQKIEFGANDNEDVFALYYKRLNKPKEEPVKIAEGIVQYSASADGKNVICLDNKGNLYHYNMKDRNRMQTDVAKFWVADDFELFLWLSKNGELYSQRFNEKAEHIDGAVSYIPKLNADLSEIYYYKDKTDSLWVKRSGVDKVKIAEDVISYSLLFTDIGVYFIKDEPVEYETLYDFIVDPLYLKEDDEELLEEKNNSNAKKWNEMLYRLWTREELQSRECDFIQPITLYYFNGEKVMEVCSCSDIVAQTDNSLLIKTFKYNTIKAPYIQDFVDEIDKIEKFRDKVENKNQDLHQTTFSNYDYFDEFEQKIKDAYENTVAWYLIKDGEYYEIVPQKEVDGNVMFFSPEEDQLFYYTDLNIDGEKYEAELRVLTLAENTIVSDDIYESKVEYFNYTFDEFGRLISLKNFREWDSKECYDLYMDKKLVAYDVDGYEVLADGSIICYSPSNEEVFLYDKGESVKIADDIDDVFCKNVNVIYYLTNEDELYSYAKGETARLENDVDRVLQFDSNRKYMYVSGTSAN